MLDFVFLEQSGDFPRQLFLSDQKGIHSHITTHVHSLLYSPIFYALKNATLKVN